MSEPRGRARAWLAVLVVASYAVAGCAPALFARTSFRGDQAPPFLSMADLRELNGGEALRKATILELLGPPVHVIGQRDGEIFVYRRVALDSETLTLNPGYLTPVAPSVPVFSRMQISGRDDLLMVFFDTEGAVRSMSSYHAVGD